MSDFQIYEVHSKATLASHLFFQFDDLQPTATVASLVDACCMHLEGGKELGLGLFLTRRGEQLYQEPGQRLDSLHSCADEKVGCK